MKQQIGCTRFIPVSYLSFRTCVISASYPFRTRFIGYTSRVPFHTPELILSLVLLVCVCVFHRVASVFSIVRLGPIRKGPSRRAIAASIREELGQRTSCQGVGQATGPRGRWADEGRKV